MYIFSVLTALTFYIPLVICGINSDLRYKYNGNYVGVSGIDSGTTWNWEEGNAFCNETFGTTLATWENQDQQYEAAQARWSVVGPWAFVGIYSDDNGTTYQFMDGREVTDNNTLWATPASDIWYFVCPIFDADSYCAGTYSVGNNNCALNSKYIVCNAPEFGTPKYYSSLYYIYENYKGNSSECRVTVYTDYNWNGTGTASVYGPYNVGGYTFYTCPTFANDAVQSAKIEALDGFECTLTFADGAGTISYVAGSGETIYINANSDFDGMTGNPIYTNDSSGISSFTVYSELLNASIFEIPGMCVMSCDFSCS